MKTNGFLCNGNCNFEVSICSKIVASIVCRGICTTVLHILWSSLSSGQYPAHRLQLKVAYWSKISLIGNFTILYLSAGREIYLEAVLTSWEWTLKRQKCTRVSNKRYKKFKFIAATCLLKSAKDVNASLENAARVLYHQIDVGVGIFI